MNSVFVPFFSELFPSLYDWSSSLGVMMIDLFCLQIKQFYKFKDFISNESMNLFVYLRIDFIVAHAYRNISIQLRDVYM